MTEGDGELEVIDLEPAEPTRVRRHASTATGAPRRRWPIVLAVAVVIALAGSALVDRSRRSNRATSTTQPGETDIGVDSRPIFSFRVGAQLLTAGPGGIRLVDTDTGEITTPQIAGLPAGPVAIVAHSFAGTVAVRVARHLYWFTLKERVAHRAEGTTAFAGTRRGSLWFAGSRFAIRVPGGSYTIGTPGIAIGATSDGLVVPVRDGKDGVVLQSESGIGTPRPLLRAPATVIGVHADRVAWVADDCGVLRCPVRVTEVTSGETATWLQLVGHPSPLVVAGTSAAFSDDGSSLAIVEPNESVTAAATAIVADLRTRATTVVNVLGRFDQPARPGSDDGTGATIEWAHGGRFLLLAPAAGPGSGSIGLVDPATHHVTASRGLGLGSTIAAVGTSASGSLDLPRHDTLGPIDTGGPTRFGGAGLSLVGADVQQVDALDLGSNRVITWYVGGVATNPAGPNSIARVTNGWLVARNGLVDLLTVEAGVTRIEYVDAGSQVFSSNHGRTAWIAITSLNGNWRVETYDPATGTVGDTVTLSGAGQLSAVDDGLVVATYLEAEVQTRFDLIDPSGRLHPGSEFVPSRFANIVASGGSRVAFTNDDGLLVYDLSTRAYSVITAQPVAAAAISADGKNLAWIDSGNGPASKQRVHAMRIGGPVMQVAAEADRVLVNDEGEVLFTNGDEVRMGSVEHDGSVPVYGLAPSSTTRIVFG